MSTIGFCTRCKYFKQNVYTSREYFTRPSFPIFHLHRYNRTAINRRCSGKFIYGVQRVGFFSQPHYVPVLKREFENIEIDIRSNTGEKIPFEFGTVSVKLHFKKLS